MTESFPANSVPRLPLTFSAPIACVGVTHIADRITELKVEDEDGTVPLKTSDDPTNGYVYYRHWTAQRTPRTQVTVSYTVAVQPDGLLGGPPIGLRPSGGGAAGEGEGFLLLPENSGTTSTHVRWDLSQVATTFIGVISAGEGDTTLGGAPEELKEQWFMVGPAGVYRAPGDVPFTGYWLGNPPFDAAAQMQWAARSYEFLSKAFAYLDPPPTYRAFIKAMSARPYGNGTANTGGFMLGIGEQYSKNEDLDYVHDVFFHEMTHQWVGHFQGDQKWFSEGLTVYFSLVLQLQGGLISTDLYEKRINERAHSYYTSPARNWSGDKIAQAGFGNEDARTTQYSRGALYFADLDARLRSRSRGKRSLTTVLYPLFVARKNGAALDQPAWEAMLKHELGEDAVKQFRDVVLDGSSTLVPVSDAFGPCFERFPTTSRSSTGGDVAGFSWRRKATPTQGNCGTASLP